MQTTDPYDSPLYIDAPVEEESAGLDYAPTSRGFVAGTTSGVLRGLVDATSTFGAGLEQIGIDNPIRSGIKSAKESWDFLKPDIPEAFELDSTVYGEVKKLPYTVANSVGVTAGGAIVGGLASGGNPFGVAAGSAAAMITQFGLGTKKEKTEEYLKEHPGDFQGAEEYSNTYAAAELGFEATSTAFAAVTFGGSKVISSLVKRGAESTARDMLKFSGKALLKDTAKTGAVEWSSEMATYGVQSAADVGYGMGEGFTAEGALATTVATAGMSMLFATVGAKYQQGQRSKLKSMLESGDEAQQTAAASLISKDLNRGGNEDLASAWDSYSSSHIDRGLPISLDDKFVELGEKIKTEKVMPGDILSTNEIIQKNAVDKILETYGIGVDGGPVQGPQTFEESLNEFLPETQESIDERQFKEDEARAAAYTYNKNQPKRTLGSIATGATEEELTQFVKDREGIKDTPRQPSPTLADIEAEDKQRIKIAEEQEAKKFEELSLAYRQAKNTPDEATAWKMLDEFNKAKAQKQWEEKDAETKKLIEEAMLIKEREPLAALDENEAQAIIHTNLSNYKKSVADYLEKSDLEDIKALRNSTNTIIRTMMQEVLPDTNDLAPVIQKAEETVITSVQGSKQQKEAKAVVKVAKKMKEAKRSADKKATPSPAIETPVTSKASVVSSPIASAPTSAVAPVTTQTATQALTAPTEDYTVDDVQKKDSITVASMDNTKGVEVADLNTPESILEREEAEKYTLEERKAQEEAQEAVEAAIPSLEAIAERKQNTVLSYIIGGKVDALRKFFDDTGVKSNPERSVIILKALRELGEAAVRKYGKAIVELKDRAVNGTLSLEVNKNVKGARQSHAIDWTDKVDDTGGQKVVQIGTHKINGMEVKIERHSDPAKKGGRTYNWDIYVGKDKKAAVLGQTEARLAAETYVTPLTEAELASAKKASRMRPGAPMSEEDKKLLDRYKSSLQVNKGKTTNTEKQTVGVVTKIDPKTGKKTLINPVTKKEIKGEAATKEFKVEAKEFKDAGLTEEEKAQAERDAELAALTKEQEMDIEEDEALQEGVPAAALRALNTVGWNKLDEALASLKGKEGSSNLAGVKYIEERIKNRDKNKGELSEAFKSGDSALNYIIKNGSKMEKAIAKLILTNTSQTKRNAIIFEVNYNGMENGKPKSASYKDGVVTLTSSDTRSALHEFIHAVTVGELAVNKEMRDKLEGLLGRVKMALLESGRLTEYQMQFISSNSNSQAFKKGSSSHFLPDSADEKLAYGLINIREFLSQALSEPAMQDALRDIRLEKPEGFLQTVWDKIVSIVNDVLGLSRLHHNALSEILMHSVTLMKQEERKGGESFTSEALKDAESFIKDQLAVLNGPEGSSSVKDILTKSWEASEGFISKLTQSTYEAVSNISFELGQALRWMETKSLKATTKRAKEVEAFLDKYRKLSKVKRSELSFYLNNYNSDKAFFTELTRMLKENNMTDDFSKVQDVLKEMHKEAEFFGLTKFDDIENYFPRRVKDYDGLVRYLRKQEDWGVMDEAIKLAEEEAEKKGRKLTDEDRADILGRMLATGRLPASYLKTPAGLKERSIKLVNGKMMKFYHDPVDALGMHIREMTDRIEINRMLGVTNRKATMDKMRIQWKEAKKLKASGASKEKIQAAIDKFQELVEKLPDMSEQIEGSLGDTVAKMVKGREITEDNQRKVKDLIRARITQVGTGRVLSAVRQAALMGSLTQISTGLRQITDNVWTMYQSGMLNTLKATINLAQGNQLIKEDFVDFSAPLKEFSQGDRWTDNMIKFSGLQLLDGFSKKISMEASILAAKEQSSEAFNKRWSKVFGDRVGQVHKDIIDGKITEDVEYLLLSNIADFQPIFLSEQSRGFLQAGNGRIFYLLKSYPLKSANNFYREIVKKFRDGDTKGGMRGLAQLGTLFILLGASSDWLIDFLNGKEPDLTISMVDTLLSLGIVSRYSWDKGKKEGFVKAAVSNILPPVGILDAPFKDLYGLLIGEPTISSMKLVPGVGALAYNRLTDEGSKKIINNTKKELYSKAAKGSTPSGEIAEVNSKIREYNKGKGKKEQLAPITPGLIAEARKRERDKNAK